MEVLLSKEKEKEGCSFFEPLKSAGVAVYAIGTVFGFVAFPSS